MQCFEEQSAALACRGGCFEPCAILNGSGLREEESSVQLALGKKEYEMNAFIQMIRVSA